MGLYRGKVRGRKKERKRERREEQTNIHKEDCFLSRSLEKGEGR